MRLFVCMDCKTIETFPLLSGDQGNTAVEDANRDPLLNDLANRHLQRHPMDLVDPTKPENGFKRARIYIVEESLWDKTHLRNMVLKNIRNQWAGFEPELYAVKATFQEDAMSCFNAHARPKQGCIDWKDDSKLLTPSSWKSEMDELVETSERKKVGTIPRKPIHLCNFCPVSTYYTTRLRAAVGAYDKEPGEVD